MIDPIEREKVEAAIKAAMSEVGVTAAELGRRLGKGSLWVSSVLKRVRDGQALTYETVRTLRAELPKVEEHLKVAGWYAGHTRPRNSIPATRSTEHLRSHRHNLINRRDMLNLEIEELDRQITDLEDMARSVG